MLLTLTSVASVRLQTYLRASIVVLCGLPGPQERRKLILPGSEVQHLPRKGSFLPSYDLSDRNYTHMLANAGQMVGAR